MKTRLSKNITPILNTLDDVDARLGDLAYATNERIRRVADMDAMILEIKQKFEVDLNAAEADIKSACADLEMWATANPDQFVKRKSLELLNGVLGFRTGTPKLVPLARAWTWEKITEQVCAFLPNFVRSKPEVDKEAILGQRDEPAIQAILPRCGLKVTQGEKFFVEPKLTDVVSKN